LSGDITAGKVVPARDSVSITLNGVTHLAKVDKHGTFSAVFATGDLPAASYSITYAFAGDAINFAAAANGSGTLSVVNRQAASNSRSQTEGDGQSIGFTTRSRWDTHDLHDAVGTAVEVIPAHERT
jgi:hypothetical protein